MNLKQWLLTALLTCAVAAVATPDRNRSTPAELLNNCTDAVIGTVVRVYTTQSSSGDYKTTFCVAEISVEKVVEGKTLEAGNIVFAKYNFKDWIGKGMQPLDWLGQRSPTSGGRYKVYLRGNHKQGFGVVEPNGFAAFPKPLELSDEDVAIVTRHFKILSQVRRNAVHFGTIESQELKRLIVVDALLSTIEKGLAKIAKTDTEEIQSVVNSINDLDRIDGDKHGEEIATFKTTLAKVLASGE